MISGGGCPHESCRLPHHSHHELLLPPPAAQRPPVALPDPRCGRGYQLGTGAGALQAVVARFFAPDGTPRTGVLAVSRPRPAHQAINYNGGAAAPLPGGGVVTVWEDESGAAATGTIIRLRSLAGDGSPLTRVLQLNQSTAPGYERGSAVIAGNGAGRYVAVWLETPVRAGLTGSIHARLLQAAGDSPNP